MKEINAKLLEEIRLHYSTCTYQIDDNDYLIVPVDETHDFLLNNFQINNLILKFYYAQSNALFSDADYKKMTETGYVGRKEQTLKPYPIVIYGAYFNRAELYTKILSLSWQPKNKRPTLNNKQIEYFEDLFPYFKEYSEGFKNGYEGFEEKYINKYLPLFPDKKDFTDKVFEHLTKKIIFKHDWLNAHSGFTIQTTESGKKVSNTGKIVNAFEDGQIQGYFYKAWKNVFSNNNLFAPLFEDYYKSQKEKNELSLKQIALKYVYNREIISEENKDIIAKKYNHTSGHKLKQEYNLVYKRINRKADPDKTKKVLENKIKLFESIISLVSKEYQKELHEDISLLKSHLSKY